MDQVDRIGMDTSKHIFQLHGVNAAEVPVLRKKLRRREMVPYFEKLVPTEIAIEACSGSHYWARLLQSFGHSAGFLLRLLDITGLSKTSARNLIPA